MEKSTSYFTLISPMSSHLHTGNLIHSSYPYPVYSTHSTSSAYDLSTSSVDIQGVFSNTWMTPTAGNFNSQLIRDIASPNESLEQPARGKKWGRTTRLQRTAIDMLSEDTLLEIFDFYRLYAEEQSRVRPWKWHRLAHVCKRWRYVITVSPCRLGLQIRVLGRSRTPIQSILDSWPTFPLVVRFKGSPKSKSLPDNIAVALRHPDRICEIDLGVTSPIAGSIIEVIQGPLRALKSIRIKVKDVAGPPLLIRNAFVGNSSPHLRVIDLDGIAFPFPAIRQVLLSTSNLVKLHLINIPPNTVCLAPDDLVTGLSTLAQLRRLAVGFHYPTSSSPPSMTGLPLQRTTLPSLTSFDFHGASEYLEEIVARIDLPALHHVNIILFNDIFFEIPHFRQLIPSLDGLGTPTRVLITHSVLSVCVSFEVNALTNYCSLVTVCRRLDWQLSFATQISSQFSPLLSSVRLLSIKRGYDDYPAGEEDVDPAQWLELFRPFTHVKQVSVFGEQFVPGIVQALVAEDMATEILPGLTKLRLRGYRESPSVTKAAEQFVATRRLSGHTVSLSG